MAEPKTPAPRAGNGAHTAAPASSAAGAADAEQLGLLPADDQAARDALMPIAEAAKSRPVPQGAGRPVGSRNRRTDLMAQYLVARYGDPLEADVAFGTMDLRKLIPELRAIASDAGMKLELTVGDLLRLQADARNRALPFIHAKRAQEDFKGDPVLPMLGISAPGATIYAGGAAPAGASIEDKIDEIKTIEHQPLSEGEDDKSHGEKSHEQGNDDGSTA